MGYEILVIDGEEIYWRKEGENYTPTAHERLAWLAASGEEVI